MTDPIQPWAEEPPPIPDPAPTTPEVDAPPASNEPAATAATGAAEEEAAPEVVSAAPQPAVDATPAAPIDAPPAAPPLTAETTWTMPPPRVVPGPAPGVTYVGFWRRFVAFLIDTVLSGVVWWALFALVVARTDFSSWRVFLRVDPVTGRPLASDAELITAMRDFLGLWLAVFGLFWLAHALYHIIFWSWRGGTIGQLVLGIQIRREADGTRIGFGTSIVRYIGYLISFWVFYLGVIWIAFDGRKQGWHDKIANTLVIRRAD